MSNGPFETEAEVREAINLPAWTPGSFAVRNEIALFDACDSAGVQLGAYDARILSWLAHEPPQTVAVIVGIILRAGEA